MFKILVQFFILIFLLQSHTTYAEDNTQLPFRGSAVYRYWMIKVYTGKLYAQPGVNIKETLGTVPLVFELNYARDISRKDFIESGDAFLKKNPGVNMQDIDSSLKKMNELYHDVKEGDTYKLVFIPGKGISLYLNGQLKGIVPGDAFAKAYLGIWLSEYSLSSSFTDEITQQN